MAISAIRGTGIFLQTSQQLSLAAGEIFNIPPGTWNVSAGPYTFLETYNSVLGIWLPPVQARMAGGSFQVQSDGVNYRLNNRTGTPIGATVTDAGSDYTSAPTITASAGGSTWVAVVGGLVDTTVTVTEGGSNYLFPPILYIPPPQNVANGVQATAIAAISSGAVSSVTVINQGAGYTVAPPIYVINDPRDNTGSGAVLTTTLTGSETIGAVLCTGQGTALTSIPTLTFSGGAGSSAAATVLFVNTAVTISSATALGLISQSALPTKTNTNPAIENSIIIPRLGFTQYNSAPAILDGGIFLTEPEGWALEASPAALTISAYGGVTDTSWIQPA